MTDITFLDDVEVRLIDSMGSDLSIVQAARVSTLGENESRNQYLVPNGYGDIVYDLDAERKDKGLINMLMRDRHGSPFEQVELKVFVKAPIFVFREWHRHRIASYNEMSSRYTEMLPEFYVPKPDRPLRQVGKPGAYSFEPGDAYQVATVETLVKLSSQNAWDAYQGMLAEGIAKEVARIVLPVNTYSQMYAKMNLRSLMNFLGLRTKTKENSRVPSFPQHEISLGADKLEDIFAGVFPWTYDAWQKNGRVAP